MKLVDRTMADFSGLLASDAPAPGGGSTAALEGALGASLLEMVAALTIGRKKYEEHRMLMEALALEAREVRGALLEAVDKDTDAFNVVTAVFAMPKETEAEKAARSEAMQRALKGCTKPPLEVMRLCLRGLELAEQGLGKFNASTTSDLAVGALSLKAAVQGAWLNVLTNLSSIKDEAFAAEHRAAGEAVLQKALPLAEKIYDHALIVL